MDEKKKRNIDSAVELEVSEEQKNANGIEDVNSLGSVDESANSETEDTENLDTENNDGRSSSISGKFIKPIAIVISILIAFFIFRGCFGGGKVSDDMYVSCAIEILKDKALDPSGMVVNKAYVYEKDDYGRAIVFVDCTTKNGRGGSDRDKCYVCIQKVEKDGRYYHYGSSSYVITDNGENKDKLYIDMLKKANDFGEPFE